MMIICAALCGLLALVTVVQHLERKDLYDRIMSRSVSEYRHTGKQEGQAAEPRTSEHAKAIKLWREGRNK